MMDVRTRSDRDSTRRRRECLACGTRFTTIEVRHEVIKITKTIESLWGIVETVEAQLSELRELAKSLDVEKLEGKTG